MVAGDRALLTAAEAIGMTIATVGCCSPYTRYYVL